MSLGNLVKIPSGPNWKKPEEASWRLKGGGLRYLQTVEGGHEIGVPGVLCCVSLFSSLLTATKNGGASKDFFPLKGSYPD